MFPLTYNGTLEITPFQASVDATSSSRRKRRRAANVTQLLPPADTRSDRLDPGTSAAASLSEDPLSPTAVDNGRRSQASPIGQEIVPSLRAIVSKYVDYADQALNCLQLAGFASPYVFAALTEDRLHQVEAYVGRVCSLNPSVSEREPFLGPVFVSHADRFQLPVGTIVGLLLAAAEVKSLLSSGTTTAALGQLPVTRCSAVFCDLSDDLELTLTDNATQTGEPLQDSGPPVDPGGSANPASVAMSTPSNETLSLMHAAIQAAVGAQSVGLVPPNCFDGNLSSQSTLQPSDNLVPLAAPMVLPSLTRAGSASRHQQHLDDDSPCNLERLKQHSSASASRLALRQFTNASLVRGRDFDIDMETSVVNGGCIRVTGIFYCHLCRKKRERTAAVRFTIARNRYPVLSNVLSHLKTHFQYRGPLNTSFGGASGGLSMLRVAGKESVDSLKAPADSSSSSQALLHSTDCLHSAGGHGTGPSSLVRSGVGVGLLASDDLLLVNPSQLTGDLSGFCASPPLLSGQSDASDSCLGVRRPEASVRVVKEDNPSSFALIRPGV